MSDPRPDRAGPAVAAVGRAAAALVDGRPASPGDLGEAWDAVERSVLREPTFAASVPCPAQHAGGADALRWLALAPERPGAPEKHRAWFLVALPGNLVALELVSEGAHATYCFRAAPVHVRRRHRRHGGPGDGRLDLRRPRRRPLPSRADRPARRPARHPRGDPLPPGPARHPVARGGARRVRGPPGPSRRGQLGGRARRSHRLAHGLSRRRRRLARANHPGGPGRRRFRRRRCQG